MHFPALRADRNYIITAARIAFHMEDIKLSKKLTKQVKNTNKFEYYINRGFFAIYENKMGEFISSYKKLSTITTTNINNVEFPIEFLKYQHKTTNDRNYQQRLEIAIELLTKWYIKPNSNKLLFPKNVILKENNDVIALLNRDVKGRIKMLTN